MRALICLVLIASFEVSCDGLDRSLQSTPKPTAAVVTPEPEHPTVGSNQMVLSDTWIRESTKIPLSGDLRSLWRVHGRIQNNSAYTLKTVRLVVRIWTKKEFVDTAVFEVKTDILPNTIQSFEQEVHLSMPAANWGWDCQPVLAQTE
jgi:hypothetical protein